MGWSRPLAVVAAGLALSGSLPAGSASATSTEHAPVLRVDGWGPARPGQLVDVSLDAAQGLGDVTVTSTAFRGPVRLKWSQFSGEYTASAALLITDKAGWYQVVAKAGGVVVAHDRLQVAPPQRPSFTVDASYGPTARPGQLVDLTFDDLYPGETATDFTVRSTALPKPVRLVRDTEYTDSPRFFAATPQPLLPPNLRDGRYAFELYGPNGRRLAQRSLTVRSARPGDDDYLGKARGPAFFAASQIDDARERGYKVRAGSQVDVVWSDAHPDPGEEVRLVATSRAFTRPVSLERDDSKAADGADPRYFSTAAIRTDLTPGVYPVTVVAHRGRVRRTSYLTVTAGPAAKRHATAGNGPGRLGALGGVLALTALGAYVVRRRHGH